MRINRRYGATRAFGALIAAVGWIVLLCMPFAVALLVLLQPGSYLRGPNADKAFLAVIALGALTGLVIGGPLIVLGQLLRIAVDMLRVQLGIFERVDYLTNARESSDEPRGGQRFGGLAGE